MQDRQKNIVFVIGAGASSEVGLPIGSQLTKTISRLLDFYFEYPSGLKRGDYDISCAMREYSEKILRIEGNHLIFDAAWHIRDAMPQAASIDQFIDSQSGNKLVEAVGKMAIVSSILKAERESKLFISATGQNRQINFESLSQTWYSILFQILVDNCNIETISQRLKRISFVVFNYDRCVQHFLFHAFKNYFRIDDKKSAELLAEVSIYHPYGKVGSLDYENAHDTVRVGFGVTPNPSMILSLMGSINTFTEGLDDKAARISDIRKLVSTSTRTVFLGFGFHRQNMALLTSYDPDQEEQITTRKYFATVKGIYKDDCELIRGDIVGLVPCPNPGAVLQDMTCYELMGSYRRHLSLV